MIVSLVTKVEHSLAVRMLCSSVIFCWAASRLCCVLSSFPDRSEVATSQLTHNRFMEKKEYCEPLLNSIVRALL